MDTLMDFNHQIEKHYASLSATDQRIADYIRKNARNIIHKRVSDIADALRIAPSTVITFCKQIGYKGYTELKVSIAASLSSHLERITANVMVDDDISDITTKIFRSSIYTLKETQKYLDQASVTDATNLIRMAKRVLVFGIGASATIAQEAYNRFLRIGIPVSYAGDPMTMRMEARNLVESCVGIAVSHSGRTLDTIETAKKVKDAGAKLIGLTSFDNTVLTQLCDVKLITYTGESNTGETKIIPETAASRLAQTVILEVIYTDIVLADYDKAGKKLDEMDEALAEIRI